MSIVKLEFKQENIKETKCFDKYKTLTLRIIKNNDKYDLCQLIPKNLMNGKELWSTTKKGFDSYSAAKDYAYDINNFDDNIVEEFSILVSQDFS